MSRMEHLVEREIEALASLTEAPDASLARTHVAGCAQCAERVRRAQDAMGVASRALRTQSPLGFDAASLARQALAARTERPSLRGTSLALAGGALVLVAANFGRIGRLSSLPSPRTLGLLALSSLRWIEAAMNAHSSATWTVLVLTAVACALASLSFAERLSRRVAVAVAMLCVAGPLFASTVARALDLEGSWPADERVSVELDDVPTSAALEAIADRAHLSLVVHAPIADRVSVKLRGARVTEALSAVLSGRDMVASREGSMLMIRPKNSANSITAPPPAPVTEAPVSSTPSPAAASPRVSVGRDVVVRAGEVVQDVVVTGGDADIAGTVTGDVAVIGGDVRIRCGARIAGEVVQVAGGAVHRDACEGDLASPRSARSSSIVSVGFGDEASGASARRNVVAPGTESWLDRFASGLSQQAFVFMLGVFFFHLSPSRYRAALASLRSAPVRTWALGFFSLLALAFAAVVLVVTLIGIPLAIVVVLGSVLVGYLGASVLAAFLGSLLPIARLREQPLLELAAGAFAWLLLMQLPVLGTWLFALSWVAAFGATLAAFRKLAATQAAG